MHIELKIRAKWIISADDDLGFEEMFEDDGLCVIEWPQFIEDIIPEERLEIEIIKNEDETRSLKLHPIGEKYENYVREVTHD